MKSPLRWVGGKNAEAEYLASLLPTHSCYVEVFGGGASVLLAKRPSEVEVYNDLNGELVNFFRVVKERPAEFKAAWKWCLVSREEFYRLRDTSLGDLDPIQRAYRFMYINRCSFGGKMEDTSPFGISARDESLLLTWLDTLDERVDALHGRLRRGYIENLPAGDLIERWGASKPGRDGAVIFCDPPYVDATGYAVGPFTHEDHSALASALGKVPGRFLVTINDHPLVRQLYDGCRLLERSKQYSLCRSDEGRRGFGELIISNYPLPTQKQSDLWAMTAEGTVNP